MNGGTRAGAAILEGSRVYCTKDENRRWKSGEFLGCLIEFGDGICSGAGARAHPAMSMYGLKAVPFKLKAACPSVRFKGFYGILAAS